MKTIIEMALETGAILITGDTPSQKSIKAFAELVRADEREKVIGEFVEAGAVSLDGTIVAAIRARGNT